MKIAKVKGGKDDGLVIYLDEPSFIKGKSDEVKDIETEDGGIMVPLPCENHHECLFVGGPSGSGKSTYIGNYIKQYMKTFPNKEIILFSAVKSDKSLDEIKKLRRYDLSDDSMIEHPIDVKNLEGSLCIFDDYTQVKSKAMREAVQDLLERVITTGRCHAEEKLTKRQMRERDIDVIVTSHQFQAYQDTRSILNECTSLTCFPGSGSAYQIKSVLRIYAGLSPKDIAHIYSLPSRWITFSKWFPQYILYERGAYVLSKEPKKKDVTKKESS